MSRNVVDTLCAMPERERFVRGMVTWVGVRQIGLPYKRAERLAGKSNYLLTKMIRFAVDRILSFSTAPLQLSVAIGVACAFVALLGIAYSLVVHLFTSRWVEGWPALMIAVLFLGGVQLLGIGIRGEYIDLIYNLIDKAIVALRGAGYSGFDQTGLR